MSIERTPYRPTAEEWPLAFEMLCGMCRNLKGCQIVEGMIEMKGGAPWPAGGWVTDPGAGVTCLSYQPHKVRPLGAEELAETMAQAVPMCDGCAARKGTAASKSLHTQRDFAATVAQRGTFLCHKPENEGKPCGGWCSAVRRQMTTDGDHHG